MREKNRPGLIAGFFSFFNNKHYAFLSVPNCRTSREFPSFFPPFFVILQQGSRPTFEFSEVASTSFNASPYRAESGNIYAHTLRASTPSRIMGQAHGGLKCTTPVFVERNIMFPPVITPWNTVSQLNLILRDWVEAHAPEQLIKVWRLCPYPCGSGRNAHVCYCVCVCMFVHSKFKIKQRQPGALSGGVSCPGNLWHNPGAPLPNAGLNYTWTTEGMTF